MSFRASPPPVLNVTGGVFIGKAMWSKHSNFRKSLRNMFDSDLLGYIRAAKEIEQRNPRMSGANKTVHDLYLAWANEELQRRKMAYAKMSGGT